MRVQVLRMGAIALALALAGCSAPVMTAAEANKAHMARLEQMFKLQDCNQDGKLSLSEIERVTFYLPISSDSQKHYVEKVVFSIMDRDSDNFLSLYEVVTYVDGKLTEFRDIKDAPGCGAG